MVIIWLLYGYYMVNIWLIYGYYMVIIWLMMVNNNYWLVVLLTILKNMSSSMGRMTSHIWNGKLKNVWNHQPDILEASWSIGSHTKLKCIFDVTSWATSATVGQQAWVLFMENLGAWKNLGYRDITCADSQGSYMFSTFRGKFWAKPSQMVSRSSKLRIIQRRPQPVREVETVCWSFGIVPAGLDPSWSIDRNPRGANS